MSRIRERHHQLLGVLQEELRHEDEIVRDDQDEQSPEPDADAPTEQGPEIDDLPLGVPAEQDDPSELPGFPRGDPTHG